MRKDEFPIIEKHVQNEINAVLNKIRAEIEEQVLESLSDGGDDWFAAEKVNECLEIIDTHISALNNDQFEGIWQNTVEEMKRRKICEDILEEAEKWDSETMSGSLLTDDDLRQLIGDGISRCKEREKEQDKVTQWIKDNAVFIKEMARMLEEADTAESEEGMTREEAKNWLNKLYARADITDEYGDMEDMQPYEEAVNMAINALHREQQFLEAGYKNGRVEFNIGGRRFMVKELAQ